MKAFMLIFASREYGAIDDVDIDLHIDVSFLDVSVNFYNIIHTFKGIYLHSKKLSFGFVFFLPPSCCVFVQVIYEDWSMKLRSFVIFIVFPYILNRLCFSYSTLLYKVSLLFVIQKGKNERILWPPFYTTLFLK